MYLNFYNMIREPFHVTPDPSFLFLSPTHKEALASIIYGIEQRKGFISIIGEVGTGKTTIIRSYLERIDRTKIKPVYVFNSNVSIKELLKTFFQEMEIAPRSDKLDDLFRQVHEVLIEEYRKENVIVLIVDEAQNMPIETLEQLRVLSNLETTNDKLIQIVLVGQPEFAHKLNLHKLRQLKQRISIQAKINPLSVKESYQYIHHRLAQVTLRDDKIFSKGALKHIVRHARGIPRSLNILCDNALIAGYGAQKNPVPAWIAKQVIAEFEGLDQPKRFVWRYAAALAAVVFLALAVWQWDRIAGALPYQSDNTTVQEAGQMGPREPGMTTEQPKSTESTREASMTPSGSGNRGGGQAAGRSPEAAAVPSPIPVQPTAIADDPAKTESRAEIDPATPVVDSEASPPLLQDNPPPEVPPAAMTWAEPRANAVRAVPESIPQNNNPELEMRRSDPAPAVTGTTGALRMVKPGDVLTKLALEVYGKSNNQIIQRIMESNPHIQNANIIQVGDQVIFPPLNPDGMP